MSKKLFSRTLNLFWDRIFLSAREIGLFVIWHEKSKSLGHLLVKIVVAINYGTSTPNGVNFRPTSVYLSRILSRPSCPDCLSRPVWTCPDNKPSTWNTPEFHLHTTRTGLYLLKTSCPVPERGLEPSGSDVRWRGDQFNCLYLVSSRHSWPLLPPQSCLGAREWVQYPRIIPHQWQSSPSG